MVAEKETKANNKITQDRILSLSEIADYLISKDICCKCGYKFRPGDINLYEDDSGYNILHYKTKQEIYFHCRSCHLNTYLKNIILH
ncbi:unnamed protein product [marine sediment metagenome]|uniref:Uncharacterized protein n=1 Tax=marine sediment metagenome TaxID=412755 RepID=X1DK44_9ZZZZ